ncbi:hypothetical protein BASA62_007046 [Batrachochytrium salamandrivorans]|nr:hypothetical protein BASA62_007046 [Batrachochytrium salamandrivorans]
MGVIKIESFNLVLDGTNKDTTVLFLALAIRDLLVSSSVYDSILFDLRGNDGGLMPRQNGIIQLFKSDVTASQFLYGNGPSIGYSVDPFTKSSQGENSGQKSIPRVTRQCSATGSRWQNTQANCVQDKGVKSDVIVRPTIDARVTPDSVIRAASAYDRNCRLLG